MSLDCSLADVERGGDLCVALSGRQRTEDLAFAVGQPLEVVFDVLRSRGSCRVLLDDSASD